MKRCFPPLAGFLKPIRKTWRWAKPTFSPRPCERVPVWLATGVRRTKRSQWRQSFRSNVWAERHNNEPRGYGLSAGQPERLFSTIGTAAGFNTRVDRNLEFFDNVSYQHGAHIDFRRLFFPSLRSIQLFPTMPAEPIPSTVPTAETRWLISCSDIRRKGRWASERERKMPARTGPIFTSRTAGSSHLDSDGSGYPLRIQLEPRRRNQPNLQRRLEHWIRKVRSRGQSRQPCRKGGHSGCVCRGAEPVDSCRIEYNRELE